MLNLDKLNPNFDLNKININNIDLDQVLTLLKNNQKIIMIVLAGVTLILAGMSFNGHRLKEQAISAQTSKEQLKLDAIKARDEAIQELNNFQSSTTTEIGQFDLITRISDDASANHVTISSLKPPESQEMGLYSLNNFSFTVIAYDFKNLMLFLRSMEKSKSPIRINSWYGKEDTDGKIYSEIDISAVHIHS